MRKLLFLALMCIVATGLMAQSTFTIGTGTENTVAPVDPWYGYTVSEQIYTAAELSGAGLTGGIITHIGFTANTAINMTSETGQNYMWRIYMGTTNQATFTSGGWIQLDAPTMTQVFDGRVATADLAAGELLTIPLSSNFTYTGNNLIVWVTEYGTGYSGTSSNRFRGTDTNPDYRTLWSRTDSSPGYIGSPTGTIAWGTGNQEYVRPNLTITYSPLGTGLDIAAQSFTGPAMIPGTANMVVNVINMGTDSIGATDYSVDFYLSTDLATELNPAPIVGTTALPAQLAAGQITISATDYNGWNWPSAGGNVTIVAKLTLATETNTTNNTANLNTYLRPDYDVRVVSVSGPVVVPGMAPFKIVLENNGRSVVNATDYSVAVSANSTALTLAGLAPQLIPLGDTVELSVAASVFNTAVTTAGITGNFAVNVQITVTPAGDDPTNNTGTYNASVFSLFPTDAIVSIGMEGTSTNNAVPFDMYYHDVVSQSIYREAELGETQGMITHIYYKLYLYNGNNTQYPHLVNVYMKTGNDRPTGFASTSNWIVGGFEQVVANYDLYSGLPRESGQVVAGTYDIWIPLGAPFAYTGGDLFVMTYQDREYYNSSSSGFYRTPDDPNNYNMTIYKHSDSGFEYDPFDPLTNNEYVYVLNFRPQIQIAFTMASETADLAITGFTGPAVIPAPASGTPISITVTNVGGTASAAYALNVYLGAGTGTPVYTVAAAAPIAGDFGQFTHTIQPADYNQWPFGTVTGDVVLRAVITLDGDNATNNEYPLNVNLRPAFDISAVSVTSSSVIPGTNPMVITLANTGFADIGISDYTVTIKANTTLLTTLNNTSAIPTIALLRGASGTITIPSGTVNNWDYNEVSGSFVFNVEVIPATAHVAVDDPENNLATCNSMIIAGADVIVEIGVNGTTAANYRMPFDMFYRESLAQSIYHAADFGGLASGTITNISYRLTIGGTSNSHLLFPVQVFMSNFSKPNGFSGTTDWVAGNEFTQVANIPDLLAQIRTEPGVPIPLGTYDIWIPLSTPFTYEGGDLIIMTFKDHTHYTESTNIWAQSSPGNHSMSIFKHIDGSTGTFNPANPSQGSGSENSEFNYRPSIKIAFAGENMGRLSGTVTTGETGDEEPVEGIHVYQGTTSTTTNSSGFYRLTVDTSEGAPVVTYAGVGYAPTTFDLSTVANDFWTPGTGGALPTGTHNVNLTAIPSITMTGAIKRAENLAPLPGLAYSIAGQTGTSATTTGDYTAVTGLYPGIPYPVTVTVPNYEMYATLESVDTTFTIPTGHIGTTYTFDILVEEAFRSPQFVSATVLPNGSQKVDWISPLAEAGQYSLTTEGGNYSVGNPGSDYYIAAHHYPAVMIALFQMTTPSITSVLFVPAGVDDTDFTLMIWTGATLASPDVAAPTLSLPITQALESWTWNEILLPTPITIPAGQDVVIGIKSNNAAMVTFDGGTNPFNNYGNKYYLNGAWTTISTVHGWADNWAIAVTVVSPPAYDAPPAPPAPSFASIMPASAMFVSDSDTSRMNTRNTTTIEPLQSYRRSGSTRAFAQQYNVYRVGPTENINPATMSPLNSTGFVQGTGLFGTFTETYSGTNEYRYAVTAVYTGSEYSPHGGTGINNYEESDGGYSNILGLPETITLTVNVATDPAGGNVAGTTIVANPGNILAILPAGSTSATLTLAPNRMYTISVSLAGYLNQSLVDTYTTDATITVTLSQSLTLFESDFSGLNFPAGWVNEDATPADQYLWKLAVAGHGAGSYAAYSESLCRDTGVCVYPDNWLITPGIYLPEEATSINLSAWAAPSGRAHPNENIFVYYTTTIAGAEPAASDFLTQRNPNDVNEGWDGEVLATNAEPIDHIQFNADNFEWNNITHAFLERGETVWVAFRHAHSRDMDILRLSDVTIVCEGSNATTYTVAGDVTLEGGDTTLTGLTVTFTAIGNPLVTNPINATVGTTGYTATLPIGLYSVRVHGTIDTVVYDYAVPNNLTVTANNPAYDIAIPVMYTVSGTVSMFVSGGEPTALVGATVTLTNQAAGGYSPLPATTAATTGGFSILTTPGTYTLTVGYTPQDGTPQTWTHYANVVVDDADVTVTVLVNAAYSVSGTIHTGENPAVPVVGTNNVTLTRAGQTTPTYFASSVATTGVFTFPAVAPGTYTLKAAGNHGNASHPYDYEHDTPIVVTNANIPTIAIVITDLSDGDISAIPTVTTLKANYPNPFNPSTTIAFDVANAGRVSIEIYNIKGQRVKSLVNDSFDVGPHIVVWNGDDAAGHAVGSGVYFYRMTAPGYSSVRKMLLMK